MQKDTRKKGLTIFIILLVLLIPVNQVMAQRSSEAERLVERTGDIPEDFEEQARVIGEQLGERFEDNIFGVPGTIGEDIILNVEEYQPSIIRSSLLEDQGVFVFALLAGFPTNPSITIPRINNVVIRRQRVTTDPVGAPVSIGRVRHISPPRGELSFDNMGYMVIPIRQIPRENDVPDEILIDVDARVFFDVSEGLTFGPSKDVLPEENPSEWNKDEHSFYAGYIRVSEIDSNSATIVLYDNSVREVRGSPFKLKVGQSSKSLSARAELGYTKTGRIFDRFTIKLDRITSIGDKVSLLINEGGKVRDVKLSEGEFIYPGSSWFVDNIITDTRGEEFKVRLRNRNAVGVFLGSFAEISNTVELSAKKLKINVTSKKPTASVAGTTSPPKDASLDKYASIKKKYDNMRESPILGFKDYGESGVSGIVYDLENLHNAAGTSVETKGYIERLLKTIERYYNNKRVERELAVNRDPSFNAVHGSIGKQYEEVKKLLEELTGDVTALPSSASEQYAKGGLHAYRQARQEYQNLINEFSSSTVDETKRRVAQAHWRIANMPPDVVNKETRIHHLNTLLEDFEEADYGTFSKLHLEKLIVLLNTLQSDYQSVSKTIIEPSTGEEISITLAGAAAVDDRLKSKATLLLDGTRTLTFVEGEQILWPESGDPGAVDWQVSEVRDKSVIISRTDTEEGPKTIRLDSEVSIDVKAGSGNKRKVKLIDTDEIKEAHVTISPVVEQAFSEAIFSLHLPIEKRALDLPLFSDTVDEEIVKTEELLEKLENILVNVRKLTEYWQKFCLITFATLWIKNLASGIFGGGKAAVARQKVGDIFKDRHRECRALARSDPASCADMSYDQYVFEHEDEYEEALESSERIVEEIQRLEASGYYEEAQNYPKLGQEYNREKDDLKYYEEMRKLKPGDETINRRYFEIRTRLKRADLEREFANNFFTQDGNINTLIDLDKKLGTGKGIEKVKGIIAGSPTATGTANMKPVMDELRDKLTGEERKIYIKLEKKIGNPAEEDEYYTHVWNRYRDQLIPFYKETEMKRGLGTYIKGLPAEYGAEDKYVKALGESYRVGTIDSSLLGEFKHNPALSFGRDGHEKDRVKHISIGPLHYVQVEYTTGGRVSEYKMYQRVVPNGPMGVAGDNFMGNVDEQFLATWRGGTDEKRKLLAKKVDSVRSCIGKINQEHSRSKYSRGNRIQTKPIGCAELGKYVVTPAAQEIGSSCTDFMDPTDCKILFNACDPVICPPSRCNLGGDWPVDNVVETGLIGSAVLCLSNFGIEPLGIGKKGGVAMPICLTGIHAGLQNLHSIIDGYRQCLITAKVSGRAVGLCDRLRSFGICEILWKEGLAIKDALEQGVLSKLLSSQAEDAGGGEYSSFQKAFDNSVESLQFFTQSYAKNTFARYSGGSLPEIGTEICKAAIFRKAPGIGNFFDEIVRPESPPQFNAFFDEVPYSDLGPTPLSQYKIFYHIYAGDTSGPAPTIYSVWLQTKDPYTNEYIHQPTFVQDGRGIVRGRRLPPNGFVSEAPDMVLPRGMQEICVDISTDIHGRRVECGFGKVTTGFALNFLTDKFTQSQLQKTINTAEECISEQSAISSGLLAGELGTAGLGALGTVSSGFVNTGIVRKCSKISPGIGGSEGEWSPVGSCGLDELSRDMGTCWLYLPTAKNLINQVSARTNFVDSLNATAIRVIEEAEKAGRPIPGFETLDDGETTELFKSAETARATARSKSEVKFLAEARGYYTRIISAYTTTEPNQVEAQFFLAETYEEEALLLLKKNMVAKKSLSKKEFAWYFKGKLYRVDLDIPDELYQKYRLEKPKLTGRSEYPAVVLDKDDDVLMKELANKLENLADKAGFKGEEKLEFLASFVPGVFYYDEEKLERMESCPVSIRYPVELLVDGTGICTDAAVLGVHILYSVGDYDVGFYALNFEGGDGHVAAGVACLPLRGEHTEGHCYLEVSPSLKKEKEKVGKYITYRKIGENQFVSRKLKDGDSEDFIPLIETLTSEDKKVEICSVTRSYWGDENGDPLKVLEAFESMPVTINVEVEACEGEEDLLVKIYENDDFFGDDFVNQTTAKVVKNKVVFLWDAEWRDDGIFGGNPEYYYEVYYRGYATPVRLIHTGKEDLTVTKRTAASPAVCTIVDAFWARKDGIREDLLEVLGDEEVYAVVNSQNCIGETLAVQFAYDNLLSFTSFGGYPGIKIEEDSVQILVDVATGVFADYESDLSFLFNAGKQIGTGAFSTLLQSSNRLKVKEVTASAQENRAAGVRINMHAILQQASVGWAADSMGLTLLPYKKTFSGQLIRDPATNAPIYLVGTASNTFMGIGELDSAFEGKDAAFLVFDYTSHVNRLDPATTHNIPITLQQQGATKRVTIQGSPPFGVNVQAFGPVQVNNGVAGIEYPHLNKKKGKYVSFAVWIDENGDGIAEWQEIYDDLTISEVKVE